MKGEVGWRILRSWREARDLATASGWDLLATGDWSWVYRDPDAQRAVRITPFDPAFDLFATFCQSNPGHPHLPLVDQHVSHLDGGSTTVMELLEPAMPDVAAAWLERLKTGDTAELVTLRDSLDAVDPGSDVPLFAGVDHNPANVLRRESDGRLVFTDAFWIEGPKLLQLISEHPSAALALYPRASLVEWARLPCMDAPTTTMILRQLEAAP